MDAYTNLLERTRVPQPSLQRFAVIQIFEKLRTGPSYLNPDSDPAIEVITQCLHSSSPAVVDQSVRELCKLVKESKLDIYRGLLELQSALEGSGTRFVDVYVKGIGFLVRFGFKKYWRSKKVTENHPFIKVLSFRSEVQDELLRQVLLFVMQCRRYGMTELCNFVRPVLNFSILRIPFSDSLSSSFMRSLMSSLASICCSFPSESLPIFEMLISGLKYFQRTREEDFRNIFNVADIIIYAHGVVLRHLVGMNLIVHEAQLSGVSLLKTILSFCADSGKYSAESEPIVERSRRLLHVHKELGLRYVPELLSPVLSLFLILSRVELEHEQLCVLKLLAFLIKWKTEDDHQEGERKMNMTEMHLLIVPVMHLVSSPSKSIKGAATDLLTILENIPISIVSAPMEELSIQESAWSDSSLELIIFRLVQHLWLQDLRFSSLFLSTSSSGRSCANTETGSESWVCQLGAYALSAVERRRFSFSASYSQANVLAETPLLLTSVVSTLLLHPTLGPYGAEALAALGVMEPKLGLTLVLSIMYYINFLRAKASDCYDMPLKLLGILPSLASHTELVPFIIQTITPMLHKDAKPVLQATAIRLLCKTWENNDRIFGSMRTALLPEKLSEIMPELITVTSMSASLRDICKKNPDRGVELILSISACIESHEPMIQMFGFQSLAHLCEADVVDFYTGWSVVEKHVLDYLVEPTVAYGLCQLLRWGAMDAEAYPEASKKILQILWEVAQFSHSTSLWIKARKSAFDALSCFEVELLESNIQDVKDKIMALLLSETNLDILTALEELEAKIITYEHSTRRRYAKEKRVSGNKIEKLLEVFPRAVFSSGKTKYASELPGAALLSLAFSLKDDSRGKLRNTEEALPLYMNTLKEVSSSLHLSRNIAVALMSLESWKPLMQRWMKVYVTFIELKSSSAALDKTVKAANYIVKIMVKMAETSIPRSAENIALGIGALCTVLPASAHVAKATASKFLLDWLFQYEHEYRQWSAAISLGSISSCLHVTDREQKEKIITGLVEVACASRHSLVKGACGVGLGFSCQDLLTRIAASENTMDKKTFAQQEADLLGKIVRALSLMISQLTDSEFDILSCLSHYVSPRSSVNYGQMTSESLSSSSDELDVDIWGVTGLLLGLGSSVGALFRAGSPDVVCDVKSLFRSWIEHANSILQKRDSGSHSEHILFSLGSCLALPSVMSFCQTVELTHEDELQQILVCYKELISALLSIRTSGSIHQSLLMASCVGAGSLIGCILSEEVHSIEVGLLRGLLQLFRETYSRPYPPIVHCGAMLGVINTMGACAGTMVHYRPSLSSIVSVPEEKESPRVMGPILASSCFEPQLVSLMQDIFLVAKNFDDHQLQPYAAWVISFLRHRLWYKGLQDCPGEQKTNGADHQSITQSVPDNSTVMKLSLWLIQLDSHNSSCKGDTVATVLRCLSQAPRLPTLDWGAVIRRCMRHEAQVDDMLLHNPTQQRRYLREECLKFSFAHANHFDSILSYLDELSDLTRFGTLDLLSQCCMLSHLSNLRRIFSTSRLDKVFADLVDYLSSPKSSYQKYSPDQKSLLKISCWTGLCQCLDEPSTDSSGYIASLIKSMEVLFSMLPSSGQDIRSDVEWTASIKCLAKAQRTWLFDFLHVSEVDLIRRDQHFTMTLKKIEARAKLVKFGAIPLNELGKIKCFLLNSDSEGLWNVLVEVVAALQSAEGTVKRIWLMDALEISCITKYPSTVLRFLALLCGSCCIYKPLLMLDPSAIVNDLPVTISSLFSSPSWAVIAESAASYLFTFTERFYEWVVCTKKGEPHSGEPIDRSEFERAEVAMHVMHGTCISLKDYLPLEKQFRLVNMVDSWRSYCPSPTYVRPQQL